MSRAALTIALLLPAFVAAQEVTIRVPVHLVTVRTLVFSGENRLVNGLEAPDFQLFDRGHPQSLKADETTAPLSFVIAIQANDDVRAYTRFLARTGSTVDALLTGARGESAILSYSDEIRVLKPFESRDSRAALGKLSAGGREARMLDAGARAIGLLSKRPRSRGRVLVFVGQPADVGSETDVATLRRAAEAADVSVFALSLPLLGRNFVSDTFSLSGPTFEERGGFRAGTDLGKLVSVLNRSASAVASADPFSILAAATGGTQLHFRTQREFEDGIAAIGVQLRSAYELTYYPRPAEDGYHPVKVEVGVPRAKVFARPGYWLGDR